MTQETTPANEIKDSSTDIWQIITNKTTGAFLNVNFVAQGQHSGSGNDVTNFTTEAECKAALESMEGIPENWWDEVYLGIIPDPEEDEEIEIP